MKIVKQVYDVSPISIFQTDCQDRFPLHIAVDNGASADVVLFLVAQNPAVSVFKRLLSF